MSDTLTDEQLPCKHCGKMLEQHRGEECFCFDVTTTFEADARKRLAPTPEQVIFAKQEIGGWKPNVGQTDVHGLQRETSLDGGIRHVSRLLDEGTAQSKAGKTAEVVSISPEQRDKAVESLAPQPELAQPGELTADQIRQQLPELDARCKAEQRAILEKGLDPVHLSLAKLSCRERQIIGLQFTLAMQTQATREAQEIATQEAARNVEPAQPDPSVWQPHAGELPEGDWEFQGVAGLKSVHGGRPFVVTHIRPNQGKPLLNTSIAQPDPKDARIAGPLGEWWLSHVGDGTEKLPTQQQVINLLEDYQAALQERR